MRRHGLTKIVLLVILVTFGACKQQEKLPEGVLSDKEMVSIITDIQLVEAAHQLINLKNMDQVKMRDTSYQMVYNKHGVTEAQFDSSLRVYTQHPKRFTEIMKQVDQNLNKTP